MPGTFYFVHTENIVILTLEQLSYNTDMHDAEALSSKGFEISPLSFRGDRVHVIAICKQATHKTKFFLGQYFF